MSALKRKFSLAYILSFIYRKFLEIVTLMALIIFLCIFINTQLYNTSENLNIFKRNYKDTLNVSQLVQHQISVTPVEAIPVIVTETTEQPLKIKLKTILNCSDIPLLIEKLQYGDYWLIKNYIRGRKSINMGCGESITYTTNGDYTFMKNLPTVVKRWSGPVSFALFAPGDDYAATMDSILYTINCLPESELIRDYVTFHIFIPKDHMPAFIAKNEEEALRWSHKCELQAPYLNVNRSKMYKTIKNLTFPINVGRNIARKTVNTYFILASDIELYPSLGLINQFLEMVGRNHSLVLKGDTPKVFVLPVFEVQKNVDLPDTKEDLQRMLNKSLAIPFHKYVCTHCHLVPKQKEWVLAKSSDTLEVFSVGKRYDKFKYWEPFYISDNTEPIFDERVTWEGQSNKRVQNYAMCLLDYEYHVLNPAFLVHAPGIKKLNLKSNETKMRLKYAVDTNRIIKYKILPEYKVLFSTNKRCVV